MVSIARLPQTGAALFGREKEIRWLDECWSGGAHVVSIVAWGGVGKSALVNGWLRGMLKDGWRGAERVFGWSFYSQGTDRMTSADEFVGAALKWFGDADPTVGSPWDKGERLAKLVKEGSVRCLSWMGWSHCKEGRGRRRGRSRIRRWKRW